MLRRRLAILALGGACASATAQTTSAPTAADSPTRPAAVKFTTAEGFRMERVAGDQLVESPAGLAFDERGRLYVAELRDHPTADPPLRGRIRLLEDTDGDGVFDTATVFADDLELPSGVVCSQGGVFVSSDREMLYLRDTDGDGVVNLRRTLVTFGGSPARHAGPTIRHLAWGPDRRIYATLGNATGPWESTANPAATLMIPAGRDVSFHPLTLAPRIEPGGALTQTFNDVGERFLCDPWTGLAVVVHPGNELGRNPFAPPLAATATVLPGSPSREAAAALVYRGGRYGTNWQGTLFMADPANRVIHALRLDERGNYTTARAGAPLVTVVAGGDDGFRPVALQHGPDDAIYIADLCRPGYPHGAQNNDPTNTAPRGRIWRLVPQSPASVPPPRPDFSSPTALAAALGETNAWGRDTAGRLLFERGATNMAPVFGRMLERAAQPVARREALRALHADGTLTSRQLDGALNDTDPTVRAAAARVAGAMADQPGVAEFAQPALRRLATDPAPRVRLAAAMSVGAVPHAFAADAVADFVARNPASPWMQHAALTTAPRHQARLFRLLLRSSPVRDSAEGQALLQELAVTIGLNGEPGAATASLAAIRELDAARAIRLPLVTALARGTQGRGVPLTRAVPNEHWLPFANTALTLAGREMDLTGRTAAAWTVASFAGEDYPLGDVLLLLFAPGLPEPLLPPFIRTLAREGLDRNFNALTQRWPLWNEAAQRETIQALLVTGTGREALVGALTREVIPGEALDSIQLGVLRALATRDQKMRLPGLLETERPSQDELVRDFLPVLELAGDMAAGRAIFMQRCVTCHSLGPTSAGPAPSDLARLSRMQLLAGVLDPSREQAAGHPVAIVEMNDGRSLWGVVRESGPQMLHVFTSEGLVRVRRDAVKGQAGQTWSLMPDDMANGLRRQDLANLLAFLQQAR